MQSEVMFAGFGGQGILLSAKILAHTAMETGYEVVWIPSYGPEMRGGTAYCMVIMGDRPIGSPIVKNPLHLVAMNRPSLDKFAPVVKSGGVVLINSSLIPVRSGRDDVDEIAIPVNEIAIEAGSCQGWHRYVGDFGHIIALDHFGASAPYKILYEKFGLTAERVVEKALEIV